MYSKKTLLGLVCTSTLLPAALHAQYTDLNMTDPSDWTVNSGALTGSGTIDSVDNWGVSYTSTLGVTQDPFSTSTTALQLKINETSGNQAGISVSPDGYSLPSSFVMTFDMWMNYNSGGFTTGSTQVGSFGITTSTSQLQAAGVGSGQLFGSVTDNGSSTYYRGYNAGTSIGATPYVGGSQSYASAYHTGLFPSVNVPAGETALDSQQYGSTVAGTMSFQWVQVNVTYSGGILSESLDGNLIASYAAATIGTNIFLGMYDINAGSAGTNGLADQNYVLFDNLTIVPEPTNYSLLAGLGALGFLGLASWRNRSAQNKA